MNTSNKTISPLVQKYALAISFLTLLCMVITLGVALYDVVQIIAPQFTYIPQNYVVSETSNAAMGEAPAINMKEEPDHSIQLEKMNAARSLTQAAIILLIDTVVFMFHWKLSNRPLTGELVTT